MIRINLLPFRAARKKENVQRQITFFALSFILVAIVLIAFHIYLNGKITTFNKKIADIKIEIAKYDKINKEIAEIKKKLAVLEKKTNIIKSLEKKRKEPVKVLDAMTEMVVAKRMWIDSLTIKGNSIQLKGVAMDETTVSEFMSRLQESTMFSNVVLKVVKLNKIQKYNLKRFEINCKKSAS